MCLSENRLSYTSLQDTKTMCSSIFHFSRFLECKGCTLLRIAASVSCCCAAMISSATDSGRKYRSRRRCSCACPSTKMRLHDTGIRKVVSVRNWRGIGEELVRNRGIRESNQRGRTLPSYLPHIFKYLHTSRLILVDRTDPSLHPQILESRFQR